MNNIRKWIICGMIVGMAFGTAIITCVNNNNSIVTNAVSDNEIIENNNYSNEYVTDIVHTTDWLRVRTKPSLNADILDVLKPNTSIVRVSKLDNGWSEVIYNGETQYMYSDYLSDTNNQNGSTNADIYNNYSYEYDNDYENDYYSADYTADEFKKLGIISWGMYRYTWYSELVLPGGGLDIEGRHNDENGFVCDIDNYICVASDSLDKGTIVDTPFGKQGKVYDCGCGSDDIIDCYVSW